MLNATSMVRRATAPRAGAGAVLLAIVAAALIAAVAFWNLAGLEPGPREFNIHAWEVRHFPEKWLYAVGDLFRRDRSLEEENADVARFLDLNRQIAVLEQQLSDASLRDQDTGELADDLRAATDERDGLENAVEATVEGRITAAAEVQGLQRALGPLPDMVWPPVDAEFTAPPRTLAISPRDRIDLKDTILLEEGLNLEQVETLEAEWLRRRNESVVAITAAGVGAYPTLISYPVSYQGMLEVVAHEWTHNYLSLRPLGVRYFKNNDLRTMNETVADIVGAELARIAIDLWPLDEGDAPARRDSDGGRLEQTTGVDQRQELRALQIEVDAMLAEGKVDEAEALMEERRRYLADNGYYIRKINQAYFAFVNLYAGESGSPGAVNPLGPKLDELRKRSGSLSVFLDVAGDLTSVEDLDRALEAARSL